MRKFYKTVFRVEVITDGELGYCSSLSDIDYAITEGDASGCFTEEEIIPLTPKECAEALMEQGSDPEFFQLDEDGNDLED